MKLTFSKQYKSIRNLPTIEVNDFAVLTGTNGSGKTHLLEAILQKHVTVENLPRTGGGIKKFDWTTFVATITEDATPEQLHKQREQAMSDLLKIQSNSRQSLVTFFEQQKLVGDDKIADPHCATMASDAEIQAVLKVCAQNGKPLVDHRAIAFATSYAQYRTRIQEQFAKRVSQYGNLSAILAKVAQERHIDVLVVAESDLRASFPLTWNASNTLQLEFANWFSAWHAAWEYNRINRYYNTQQGEVDRHFLSDDDFRKLYGEEPWKITNEVLRTVGFRYQFTSPTTKIGNLDQTFQLRLEDPEAGTLIKSSELSSGEKILLAVTLMLHQSDGDLNLVQLPQLLLLDEIDAPLHPSFTRALIEILRTQFVSRLGVAVLLTTHSPSTVALAPPECIYELVRSPRRIQQISKGAATQILSSGYVSVAPGDTVVITESSADPEYYQAIHEALCLSRHIPSDPPLRFIAASAKGNDGVGGGCNQVQNWAPKLHELGLHRFRGLIDNDGKNQSNKIISTLNRYSIENYLFDPLTLAAYLLHRGITEPFGTEAPSIRTIRDFLASEVLARQNLMKGLCEWLATQIGIRAIADSPPTNCEYVGFQPTRIPVWWLETRGHDLESIVRAPLNTIGVKTGRGALLKESNRDELIKFQTQSYPELISKDFIAIFSQLRKI